MSVAESGDLRGDQDEIEKCTNGNYINITNVGSINSNSYMKNVTTLSLAGQNLKEIPNEILVLESVIEIDLSNNNLKQIPDSFANLKRVRFLNLSENSISKIPDALFNGLYLIKYLNLSNNNLVTFHKQPCCLTLLQHLDLHCNQLVAPPPWLLDDAPASLNYLDLSGNPCFQLWPVCPESLDLASKVCDNVTTLKLNCCGYRGGLHERYLSYFSNITRLEISNPFTLKRKKNVTNSLHDFDCLPIKLKVLLAQDVGVGYLPKAISSLPDLRYLDLSRNLIHWLPPFIQDLKSLVILHLEGNKMCLLPVEMNHLTNLKELYLSNNQLTVDEGFQGLVSLEVLDLYQNQFLTVPNLTNLTRLQALDLSQNYFSPPKFLSLGKHIFSYENLKDCLRSKYLPQNERGLRVDSPKEPEEDTDYQLEELEFSEGEFDDNFERDPSNDGCIEPYDYEETKDSWDWDLDENYEPIENTTRSYNIGATLQELYFDEVPTPYEITKHPHYLLPYRKISPIRRPKSKDLPPPVEGQFDD